MQDRFQFLKNSGEIGELILNNDWDSTSIGHIQSWPLSLQITLYNVLHSKFPMFLFWGEEFLCFYNEAFQPSLGAEGKHRSMGKKAIVVWGEVWHIIGPLLQKVYVTGEPVFFENLLVPFYRNGKVEDTYWTFSYSPALGDNGEICGVLVTCIETTKYLHAKQKPEQTVCASIPTQRAVWFK